MSNVDGTNQHGLLGELMLSVRSPTKRGVLVVGGPWTGKTTLLRDAEKVLHSAGFFPIFVSARAISNGAMGCAEAVLASLDAAAAGAVSLRVSSSSGDSVSDAVDTMNTIAELLNQPVLILDALDEAASPRDLLSQLEPIVARARGWRYIISTRFDPHAKRRLSPWLDVYELNHEADQKNVFLAGPADRSTRHYPSQVWAPTPQEFEDLLGPLASDPLTRRLLLRLAICGAQSLGELRDAFHISPQQLVHMVSQLSTSRLVLLEKNDVVLAHEGYARRILELQFGLTPLTLAQLSFGKEEGETDPLLDTVYQTRGGATELGTTYSIVVGSRGSGKSALVRRISEGKQTLSHTLIPAPVVTGASELIRLVPGERWDDHDSLRAAWTLLIAAEVAMRLPDGASDSLRHRARKILAAAGKVRDERPAQRILQWFRAHLGGSKLQFSLGLVKLDAPLDSAAGGATVDLKAFLCDADEAFGGAGSGVVCLLDRVDEIFKHDRPKQEACLQALLQAERDFSALSGLRNIRMVVFLRDDLLQAYDIQEKNKLVSRTLRLDWSTDDWMTVLVRRLAANPSLLWLRDVISLDRPIDAVLALSRLLPPSVEDLPIDRWLVESLRDGNGQISPRLAVLLLLFARDLSPNREQSITALPIFQEGALRTAMDKVSDLAYDEVVSDFKVASAFVSNCRAAKLSSFQLEEVAPLFSSLDGNVSDQVRALERLGFLERIVIAENGSVNVSFRIPKVFSRSWAH